ncbi:TetR family transcriptional regulator [Virgibacillus phasianinus]|uniref:TetR family transcriptional regulator n=1 Tax=Virgibacillus phasianinus TaxID=2017483 RepID=A0A220U207_9BACI|nr:TetR/AcrR family transcriptional regulator [Virgibacillus phasianinus]ASK62130.1 TetR family transcriptional regulator [Virgibacillus phasianinus]
MTPKQEKIMEAAIRLIADKGYHNTSTSEIAKEAGVAEGTIFRHYKTKKDLLVAIVGPVMMKLSAPVLADKFVNQVFEQNHGHLEEFLYYFIKNRFEFAEANVDLIKILVQELAFHPDIQETFKQIFHEKVYPAINKSLDYYKNKGELQNLPNETLIRMVVPTIIGFLVTRFIVQPNKEWDDEVEIRQTVKYILHGIGTTGES